MSTQPAPLSRKPGRSSSRKRTFRPRFNALRARLAGDGSFHPVNDRVEFHRRQAILELEFPPGGELARILLRRVAIVSLRLDRSDRYEQTWCEAQARAADADGVRHRNVEADRWMDRLNEEPASASRRLERLPEGLDRMIAAWVDLKMVLERDHGSAWTLAHQERAENLMGRFVFDARVSRVRMLSEAIRGDFAQLHRLEAVKLDVHHLQEWSRDQMTRLIDDQIKRLETLRSSLHRPASTSSTPANRTRKIASRNPTNQVYYRSISELGLTRALMALEILAK